MLYSINKPLLVTHKRSLYNSLLENSGLYEKKDSALNEFKDCSINLIKKYLIEPELLNLFEKTKRICKTTERLFVDGITLSKFIYGKKFPSYIGKEQLQLTINNTSKEEKKITPCFNLTGIDMIPKFSEKHLVNFIDDLIEKDSVAKSELLDLFNLYLEYLKLYYKTENFLPEYVPEDYRASNIYYKSTHFLDNICSSWKQVYEINKDWYAILYNTCLTEEEKISLNKKDYNKEVIEKLKNELIGIL